MLTSLLYPHTKLPIHGPTMDCEQFKKTESKVAGLPYFVPHNEIQKEKSTFWLFSREFGNILLCLQIIFCIKWNKWIWQLLNPCKQHCRHSDTVSYWTLNSSHSGMHSRSRLPQQVKLLWFKLGIWSLKSVWSLECSPWTDAQIRRKSEIIAQLIDVHVLGDRNFTVTGFEEAFWDVD